MYLSTAQVIQEMSLVMRYHQSYFIVLQHHDFVFFGVVYDIT